MTRSFETLVVLKISWAYLLVSGCQSTYSVAQSVGGYDTESASNEGADSDAEGDSATTTDRDSEANSEMASDSESASDKTSGPCDETCIFPVADHVDLTYAVWGEENVHYYIPKPGWAMAAIQASRMLAYYFSDGLSRTVSPNWFLATALKESFLGCCEDTPGDTVHPSAVWEYQEAAVYDGCFQIEDGTAFVEMQRIFPSHFGSVAHSDVIADCNVESSALTMAFYDAFAFGMMFNWLDSIDDFFSVNRDSMATETAFSLAYNRGVWSTEFASAIGDCAAAVDMLDCIFGTPDTVAKDHAYAITRYIQDLDEAALEGRCYNETMTARDVADYIDAVSPILAPNNMEALRESALAAFETAANGESGTFQSTFGAVLKVLESEPLADPFPKLNEWYGVQGPGSAYVFSWPKIENTCEIIVPII